MKQTEMRLRWWDSVGITLVTIMALMSAVAQRPGRLFNSHNILQMTSLALYTLFGALEALIGSRWGSYLVWIGVGAEIFYIALIVLGINHDWSFAVQTIEVGLVWAVLFLWRIDVLNSYSTDGQFSKGRRYLLYAGLMAVVIVATHKIANSAPK